MKKTTILLFGLLMSINLTMNAQSVIENVNFDTYVSASNNDLKNHFPYNSFAMSATQIQTNGITGGCLAIADTNNWGNDNAIYCSKFKGITGGVYTISICFKYDSTTVNTTRYERPVSIWLEPHSDPNHYLITTISRSKTYEQITYGWVNTTSPNLPLLNNHWYKFSITATFVGGVNSQINIVSNTYNLGVSGTGTPTLVGTLNGTFNDNTLISDTSISIGINGAHFGGTKYLDNFYYQGIKSPDSCLITTGIPQLTANTNDLTYSIQNNVLKIASENDFKNGALSVYTISGQEVMQTTLAGATNEFNLSQLASGMYFFTVRTTKNNYTAKFIIAK